MNRKRIAERFRQLVEEGREGFTVDLEGEIYDEREGFAVASRTCTTVEEALDVVRDGQYIGYWRDPETGREFVEVVDILHGPNGLAAIMLGIRRGQHAIYSFRDDTTIDLRGFYGGYHADQEDSVRGDGRGHRGGEPDDGRDRDMAPDLPPGYRGQAHRTPA